MTVKVSVLTPVYNAEPFLAEAIESILTQTLSDFEFILVDDGSSDGSAEILRDYSKRDKRIRVFTLPQNRGMPYALNYGLQRARAPLIARMDGDDISLPERLQKQYDYMQEHPEVSVLGVQGILFTEEQGTQEKKFLGPLAYPVEEEYLCLLYEYGLSPVGHPFAMYRLSLAREVGGYREFFRIGADDQDFFARMWDKSRVANLPDTLLWYRSSSPTSIFIKKFPALAAGSFMSILCSLYRQAGREDPIAATKTLTDLPAHLGLPKSVTLADLQSSPYWAMRAVLKHVKQYPISRAAKWRLYRHMAQFYRERRNFPDGKYSWCNYIFCKLAEKIARYLPSRSHKL